MKELKEWHYNHGPNWSCQTQYFPGAAEQNVSLLRAQQKFPLGSRHITARIGSHTSGWCMCIKSETSMPLCPHGAVVSKSGSRSGSIYHHFQQSVEVLVLANLGSAELEVLAPRRVYSCQGTARAPMNFRWKKGLLSWQDEWSWLMEWDEEAFI